MSYANKIGNYQGECEVLLSENGEKMFSDYIRKFSEGVNGFGLDIGAGPGGCNGKFFSHCTLDGADFEEEVVSSLPKFTYRKRFSYRLGGDEKLHYKNNTLDFVVCSCVIQHLNSLDELEKGIREISRVLKDGGKFYLMFKSGNNNTLFTHFNVHYGEERTFRVFHPDHLKSLSFANHLEVVNTTLLLDDNWIPYACMTFTKF